MLAEAQRRGWAVEGVEINRAVAEDTQRRLDVPVHTRGLEQVNLANERYAAVVINQVLEHLFEPQLALQEIRRILRPGGVCFIGVPCFTSPIPLALKRDDWYALLPEEHVWQFGPRSLRKLLKRAGLEVVFAYRGCTGYWGAFSAKPRDALRWTVYRAISSSQQGDFLNYVVRTPAAR